MWLVMLVLTYPPMTKTRSTRRVLALDNLDLLYDDQIEGDTETMLFQARESLSRPSTPSRGRPPESVHQPRHSWRPGLSEPLPKRTRDRDPSHRSGQPRSNLDFGSKPVDFGPKDLTDDYDPSLYDDDYPDNYDAPICTTVRPMTTSRLMKCPAPPSTLHHAQTNPPPGHAHHPGQDIPSNRPGLLPSRVSCGGHRRGRGRTPVCDPPQSRSSCTGCGREGTRVLHLDEPTRTPTATLQDS